MDPSDQSEDGRSFRLSPIRLPAVSRSQHTPRHKPRQQKRPAASIEVTSDVSDQGTERPRSPVIQARPARKRRSRSRAPSSQPLAPAPVESSTSLSPSHPLPSLSLDVDQSRGSPSYPVCCSCGVGDALFGLDRGFIRSGALQGLLVRPLMDTPDNAERRSKLGGTGLFKCQCEELDMSHPPARISDVEAGLKRDPRQSLLHLRGLLNAVQHVENTYQDTSYAEPDLQTRIESCVSGARRISGYLFWVGTDALRRIDVPQTLSQVKTSLRALSRVSKINHRRTLLVALDLRLGLLDVIYRGSVMCDDSTVQDVATDVAFVFGELIDLFVSQPKLHKDSSAINRHLSECWFTVISLAYGIHVLHGCPSPEVLLKAAVEQFIAHSKLQEEPVDVTRLFDLLAFLCKLQKWSALGREIGTPAILTNCWPVVLPILKSGPFSSSKPQQPGEKECKILQRCHQLSSTFQADKKPISYFWSFFRKLQLDVGGYDPSVVSMDLLHSDNGKDGPPFLLFAKLVAKLVARMPQEVIDKEAISNVAFNFPAQPRVLVHDEPGQGLGRTVTSLANLGIFMLAVGRGGLQQVPNNESQLKGLEKIAHRLLDLLIVRLNFAKSFSPAREVVVRDLLCLLKLCQPVGFSMSNWIKLCNNFAADACTTYLSAIERFQKQSSDPSTGHHDLEAAAAVLKAWVEGWTALCFSGLEEQRTGWACRELEMIGSRQPDGIYTGVLSILHLENDRHEIRHAVMKVLNRIVSVCALKPSEDQKEEDFGEMEDSQLDDFDMDGIMANLDLPDSIEDFQQTRLAQLQQLVPQNTSDFANSLLTDVVPVVHQLIDQRAQHQLDVHKLPSHVLVDESLGLLANVSVWLKQKGVLDRYLAKPTGGDSKGSRLLRVRSIAALVKHGGKHLLPPNAAIINVWVLGLFDHEMPDDTVRSITKLATSLLGLPESVAVGWRRIATKRSVDFTGRLNVLSSFVDHCRDNLVKVKELLAGVEEVVNRSRRLLSKVPDARARDQYIRFSCKAIGMIVGAFSAQLYSKDPRCLWPRLVLLLRIKSKEKEDISLENVRYILGGLAQLDFSRDKYLQRILNEDVMEPYFEKFACGFCSQQAAESRNIRSMQKRVQFFKAALVNRKLRGEHAKALFKLRRVFCGEILPHYLNQFGHMSFKWLLPQSLLLAVELLRGELTECSSPAVDGHRTGGDAMPNLACPLKATAEEAMFDLLRLLLPSFIKLLQGPGSSAEIRCEVFLCFTQLLDCYRLMRIRHPGEYKSPVWQKQWHTLLHILIQHLLLDVYRLSAPHPASQAPGLPDALPSLQSLKDQAGLLLQEEEPTKSTLHLKGLCHPNQPGHAPETRSQFVIALNFLTAVFRFDGQGRATVLESLPLLYRMVEAGRAAAPRTSKPRWLFNQFLDRLGPAGQTFLPRTPLTGLDALGVN